ncbi:DUF2187 family protein [Alkalibacterium sp. MB6]|uniref:DUF2187 family protein n=1 Tax=Alkalibacterium sp. MB6 TaxID=2081965 RepID=UPI00192A5134|nr:DUF2187 family protein [Alkalibacterium sp. MB6]
MAKVKITAEVQQLVETELRKGASNSRIANLLNLPYKEAVEIIETIKENLRPDVGDEIIFSFRDEPMEGTIEKLLTNSAIVRINWKNSTARMHDLVEEKTVVNFKDIEGFKNQIDDDFESEMKDFEPVDEPTE